jgi:succinoglycan biosynthesis transport protein ExoP
MDQEKLMAMADVREIWLFAKRNIKLVAIVVAVFALLALLLAFVMPAKYMGTASVMLQARKTKVSAVEEVVSDLAPDSSIIRSEVDVIQSRSVIDRVINNLNLMKDPAYNPTMTGAGWLGQIFKDDNAEAKKMEENTIRASIADKLAKNLDVVNDGRSYSIVIIYRDHDPQKAMQIANAFADEYLVDQLEVKYDATQRANTWLQKRMAVLKVEVNNAEKAVEEFKAANNLVSVGDETVNQQQISALNTQLLTARAERAQAQARLDSVKGLRGEELETASSVVTSQLIGRLKDQEAEVRRKEADLSTRYGDRHPMIINTRNELNSIREKIGEEIKKTISGLQNDALVAQAKVSSLEKDLAKLEGATGVDNKAMVTLRQLEREAAAGRSLYESFLTRFKETAGQQDFQLADARIIARADLPQRPYFPNPVMFVIVGIALGGLVGTIAALLLEYMDRGFRAISVIEKVCNVSGLGMVPIAEVAQGQLPTDYILEKPLSAYAESIRSIRTAIHFSNVDAAPKVIAITSTLPGEGKTIFAASFARLLAQSGSRVLLIDADMRRPRMHSLLGLDKDRPGLAAVLAGEAALDAALQKDTSGAHVIIAHSKTPNPQDLLASKQMERLLTAARQNYDTIIIDTPPVSAVADAAVVAKLADTTVYIVRWVSTPREVVAEGIRQLQNFNVKLAGVVLTQVDLNEQKQYGYGDYGYYYGKYKDYYTN